MTTAGVPTKLLPVSWQVAQLLVMPVWFIAVPLNAVVLLWQDSHAALVGMWLLGMVLTTGVPLKVLPLAWQVAQPVVMPAWFMAVPGPNAVVLL